jgi:predicted secreted protein
MSTPVAIATYFVLWWITLFAVLPFGVKSRTESDTETEPGTDPGAPTVHVMWRKVLWTTLVATIIYGGVYLAYVNNLLPIEFLKRISTPPHQ